MKKCWGILLIPLFVLRVVGFTSTIIGAILACGWYIEWLDVNFLWKYVAYFIGFITIPLLPLAVLIEFFWHSWPKEVTFAFIANISGIIILTVSGILYSKVKSKQND